MHRADTLIAEDERRRMEKEKVRVEVRICWYPGWARKEGDLRWKRQLRNEKEIQKDQVDDGKRK